MRMSRVRTTAKMNLIWVCLLGLVPAFYCASCSPGNELWKPGDKQRDILLLLEKIREGKIPLSICIAEALPIAGRYKDRQLAEFCRKELAGYSRSDRYEYRYIDVCCPLDNAIPLFCGETLELFCSIERNPELFRRDKLFIPQPISLLEEVIPVHPDRSFIKLICRDHITGLASGGVYYARGNSYLKVVAAVRGEFIEKLTLLLASDPRKY